MTLARDAVVGIIAGRATPICATCLSDSLRLEYDLVVNALEDLELRSDYPVGMGVCGDCDRLQLLAWPRQAA